MENIPQLHPLSVGELLDKAINLYKRKFMLVTAISAVAFLPTIAIQASSNMAGNGSPSWLIAVIVFGLAAIIMGPMGTACLVYIFGKGYVNNDLSFSRAINIAKERFLSIIGANILKGLALGAPFALLLCVTSGIGVASVVLLVLYVPFALWLSTNWAVTDQLIVLERLGASDSMRRSWHLISASFWRNFGIVVAATALTWFISGLPSLFIEYGGVFFPEIVSMLPYLSAGISYLGTIIATPIALSVYVVLYYDLRVRMEGFDLELMTQLQK